MSTYEFAATILASIEVEARGPKAARKKAEKLAANLQVILADATVISAEVEWPLDGEGDEEEF